MSEKPDDMFRIDEIASVQSGLLSHLRDDPTDISIKIAALRATAELLQNAVTTAVLNAQFAHHLNPKR